MTSFGRTPVLPEAAPVGALSAHLRRPRPRSATSAYVDSRLDFDLTLKPPPERRMPAERRALHHDVAGALEIPDEPLCDVVGHECVRVVLALAALVLHHERGPAQARRTASVDRLWRLRHMWRPIATPAAGAFRAGRRARAACG